MHIYFKARACIKKYEFLFFTLIQKQFILRYRRTLLGYLWNILNPLIALTILALVFSRLFGQDPREFAIFLFSGLVAFNFFSASLSIGSTTFLMHHGLMDKVYVPKILFPLTVITSAAIDSFLVFIALLLVMFFLGSPVSLSLLVLPVSYLALIIFTFGLTLIVSITTVFFRDFQQVLPYILQSLFFLSPILYPKTNFTDPIMSLILNINPISVYVELFRAPINEGRAPDLVFFYYGFSYGLVSLAVGLFIFLKCKHLIICRL